MHLISALRSNLVLKVFALVLGFGLWLIVSSMHSTTIWVEVPLSFYNQYDTICVHAPETMHVQLAGKRALLRSLDLKNLAIHIDAQELNEGKQPITIQAHNLFLPDTISVVNYSPLNNYIEKITL